MYLAVMLYTLSMARVRIQTQLWTLLDGRLNVFLSRPTYEIGINSAVLHYNDGVNGLASVLRYFDLSGIVSLKNGQSERLSASSKWSGKTRTLPKKQESIESREKGTYTERKRQWESWFLCPRRILVLYSSTFFFISQNWTDSMYKINNYSFLALHKFG